MSILDDLSPRERAELLALGFHQADFDAALDAERSGHAPPNRVPSAGLPPPRPGLPPAGTRQGDALVEAGLQLLGRGAVAVLLLNGGMATRFGGRVKGVVEALPGRSFLALQAQRLLALGRRAGRPIPLLLLNSHQTEAATRTHLAERDWLGLDPDDVLLLRQSAAPRLRPDGGLFRGPDGRPSWYGPGHGDALPTLRADALDWLRARGVEHVLVANIDNLGADPDPLLVGAVAADRADLMVEVVRREPGDVGGAPATVDGRTVLLEGFAFPPGFDPATVPVFNTNTLWFRREALDRPLPLRWYRVEKEAFGAPVVQLERLIGQASWFLDTGWLVVGRDRFLPTKSPEDLATLQPALRARFGGRLPLADG